MSLSQKHKIFADEYIKHGDGTKAYMAAYPKTSKETARPQAYRLLQNLTIQDYIKGITDKINNKAENMLVDSISRERLANLLTVIEKREILAKIARGEQEVEDLILVRGEVKKIRRKPSVMEMVNAIDKDNKMTGDNAPINQNVNIKGDVQTLIDSGKLILDAIQIPAEAKVLPPITD